MNQQRKDFLTSCFPRLDLQWPNQEDDQRSLEDILDLLLEAENESENPLYPNDRRLSQLLEIFPTEPVAYISGIIEKFPDDTLEEQCDALLAFKNSSIKRKSAVKLSLKQLFPLKGDLLKKDARFSNRSFVQVVRLGPHNTKTLSQGHRHREFVFDFGPEFDAGIQELDRLRELVRHFQEQRRLYFSRAAAAFQQGNLTGQQAASFYSQQGRDLAPVLQKLYNQLGQLIFTKKYKKRIHFLTFSILAVVMRAFPGTLSICTD